MQYEWANIGSGQYVLIIIVLPTYIPSMNHPNGANL